MCGKEKTSTYSATGVLDSVEAANDAMFSSGGTVARGCGAAAEKEMLLPRTAATVVKNFILGGCWIVVKCSLKPLSGNEI